MIHNMCAESPFILPISLDLLILTSLPQQFPFLLLPLFHVDDLPGRGIGDGLRFLLLILLLPVSSTAETLTCSRLPLLMDSFLAHHYAMKSMTAEITANAVDQMTKSLDPSKTLLYESDGERLKPALHGVFASMQTVPFRRDRSSFLLRRREGPEILL